MWLSIFPIEVDMWETWIPFWLKTSERLCVSFLWLSSRCYNRAQPFKSLTGISNIRSSCQIPVFSDWNFDWKSFHNCTDVRFASFLSSGFTTMAVIISPERKLAKRTSVNWSKMALKLYSHLLQKLRNKSSKTANFLSLKIKNKLNWLNFLFVLRISN